MKNKLLANHMEVSNQKPFGSARDDFFGATKTMRKSKTLIFCFLLASSTLSEIVPELLAKNPRIGILTFVAILALVRIFATARVVVQ